MADPKKPVPVPSSLPAINALIPVPGSDGYKFFENVNGCTLEKTADFRRLNAWWLMEMAYLAYGTLESFALEQMGKVGLTGKVFGFDQVQPPHILVANNNDVIVVAFRGTKVGDLPDTLADAQFLPELTNRGFVHRGFQNGLVSTGVWEQAKKYIASIPGNQIIFFTGHSLGAALATLAAQNYSDPSGRQQVLYTFGSPRVGDELIFCAHYPLRSYRIVNDQDVVAHIPTPPLFGHVCAAMGVDGTPIGSSVWEELESRFAGAAMALAMVSYDARRQRLAEYLLTMAPKPLTDHAPLSYATKIWNAV